MYHSKDQMCIVRLDGSIQKACGLQHFHVRGPPPRTPLHSPAWLARLLQKQRPRTAPSSHTGSTTSLPSIGSMSVGEQHRKVVRFRGDGEGDGQGVHARKDSGDTVKIVQPSPRRLEPRTTFE